MGTKFSPWNAATATVLCAVMYLFRTPFIDDAYITFRYAQRLVDTGALSWNDAGSPVVGTTSILWTFLIAALYRLGIPIEQAALGLTVIAVWALLYSLLAFAKRVSDEGHLSLHPLLTHAILTVATLHMPVRTGLFSGMETALYCLLVVGCIRSIGAAPRVGGICAGLATLTRPDGILLLFVNLLFQRKNRHRSIACFLLITVPWFLYSYHTFGEFLPSSVQAKRLLYPSSALTNFLMFFEAHTSTVLQSVLMCSGAAGLVAGVSMKLVRPFVAWLVLYAGGITASGIKPIFFWYFTPTWLFGVFVGGVAGVAWLISKERFSIRALKYAAMIAALGVSLDSLPHDIHLEGPFLREHRYREIVRSFHDRIAPTESILVGEAGIIGFGFPSNEIIDSAGINSLEVRTFLKGVREQLGAQHPNTELAHLSGWQRALIERFNPAIIIAARSRFDLAALEIDPWFSGRYEREALYPAEHVNGIGVYRRKPSPSTAREVPSSARENGIESASIAAPAR